MATYYVRTDGNDSNAGTSDSSGGAWLTIDHAAATVAGGDTVNIRASAGDAASFPSSSLDYSISAFFTPANGSENGRTRWIGYNGIPTIGVPGLTWYNVQWQHWKGLYFVATNNTFGDSGILNSSSSKHNVVESCIFNLNNKATMCALDLSGEVAGCVIRGHSSSPSSSSNSFGIIAEQYGLLVHGCRIYNCRDSGIIQPSGKADGGVQIYNNLIYGCAGDGVIINPTSTVPARVVGNTIHGNAGHGVNVASTNGAAYTLVRNNNITSHTQSGKAGINVATSSSDPRKAGWGYNNVWNNTANYTNVSAESTDLSVDPGYADAANGDFTPSNATLKAAFPTSF